jgi:hypothetical protein
MSVGVMEDYKLRDLMNTNTGVFVFDFEDDELSIRRVPAGFWEFLKDWKQNLNSFPWY